jgi:hypothetical protein
MIEAKSPTANGNMPVSQIPADFVARVPAISAAVTASSLLLSVSHEWGYFLVIDYRLISVVSIADYGSLLLQWLPLGVLFYGFNIVLYFVLPRWKPRRKIIRPLSWPANILIVCFSGGGGIALVLSTLPLWYYLPLALSAVGSSILIIGRELYGAKRPVSWFQKLVVIYTIPLMMLSCAFGMVEARTLVSKGAIHEVRMENGDVFSPVIFLRGIDKGIIIRHSENNRTEFWKWSDVKNISRVREYDKALPVICGYWPSLWSKCEEEPDQ